MEHSVTFSKFHISLFSCWSHSPLVEKTSFPIWICCNWKDKAALSLCTDWDGCRNSLKELSQNSRWTMNIFLEVAFQFWNVLKQQVECVDDWMFVFWITVGRQKVMPPVFLFCDIKIWMYASLTKFHYNVSECIVDSQYSLHVCWQSSFSATTVICCTSSLA
jgi:hypothetical protein